MKTPARIILAVVLFFAPILVRAVAFYQNPFYKAEISRPDFASFKLPQPPTPSSSLAAVAVPAGEGKVVIIDAVHGNQYVPNEVEPLVTALSARGGRVEFDKGAQPLASQLKYASAYIIFSPSLEYSGEELRAIRQFIESGGRLLVFADPTRFLISYDSYSGATFISPDVNYVNPVLAPYGLSFVNDYLYNLQDNEGNFRNVKFVDFADSPLTADLKMVVFYGVHSIQASTGSVLIRSDRNTFSSLTDQRGTFAPLALSANGQVLAAGDFSFLTNPFSQVADNGMLLGAIADFALGSERAPSLVNFPYLFNRPISLVTAGTVKIDSSLLGPIATLQNTLNLASLSLHVRPKAADGDDVIVLGSLEEPDAISVYTKAFGITFSTETTLEIKGFGEVSASDSGLLLFSKSPKSHTLVLLAPTASMLPELVNLVAGGDLFACVVQESVGVCSLSVSEDGYLSDNQDFRYDFTSPSLTPMP
ncbi:MAG: hypothetical protein Fur0016_20590 [Anaerolineales bacterium]